MKKHITSMVVTVLLLSVLAGNLHAGTYSGGTGEPNNPYKISKVADWQELMTASGDWNKYFLLTADINLEGVSLTPVGNSQTNFIGVFDGNGHVIRNAVIDRPSYYFIGLFGWVGYGGQIKNLGVVDTNITGQIYVSGLAALNTGNLNDCYVTGTVTGNTAVGGLVGDNYYGLIMGCHAIGTVTATGNYAGGLAGYNYYGTISASHTAGSVSSAGHSAGGFVGVNNGGDVTECYTTSPVTCGKDYAGGFVGQNFGEVTACCASGTVKGGEMSGLAGGFVGNNGGSVALCCAKGQVTGSYYVGGFAGENNGNISSCYATGSASGSFVGGLTGYNGGSVFYCYSTGMVSGSSFTGGLTGYSNGGDVSSSFWDIETSGLNNSAGGEGKSTIEMKTRSTFASADWDFDTVWAICDGTNYPRLQWQIPADDWACPDGIDFNDYAILAKAWMSAPESANWNSSCDISDVKDNVINWNDLTIFAEDWLTVK